MFSVQTVDSGRNVERLLDLYDVPPAPSTPRSSDCLLTSSKTLPDHCVSLRGMRFWI